MVLPRNDREIDELRLTQDTFLTLVRAAGAEEVVGIDPEAFAADRRDAPNGSGLGAASAPDPLVNGEESEATPPWLGTAIETVARPDTAVIVARDIPEVGRQVFYHYRTGDTVVERTVPPEGGQRLAVVGGPDDLVPRILELMPVAGGAGTAAAAQVELSDLLEAKRLAEDWQTQAAAGLLGANGLAPDQAASLVDAIQRPRFGGTITLLSIAGAEIDDARDIGAVQGDDAAWVMYQTVPGESMMTVRRTDGPGLAALLADDLSEL